MEFEKFAALPSVKQREREFVRMQWKSFETLERINKNLEKIIEILDEMNKKE